MIVGEKICKSFGHPPQNVLENINFKIETGEFVSISGRSGSGKSTLLYIVSTLDKPTSGKIFFDDDDIAKWSENKLHEYRNLNIGFIFQFHYLLPELTALENILLPPRNLGKEKKYKDKAMDLLKLLNIENKYKNLATELSGGEQQRVAIARALIMDPKYIFADEPTGNLDTHNGLIVMDILKEVNRVNKTTICLVTHEPEYSKMADREIFLVDGKVSVR